LPEPATFSKQWARSQRLLVLAPVLLFVCLAAHAFAPSAQAAGSSAVGWGENYYGQVGNGTPTEAGCACLPNPTAMPGLSDATQIAGGSSHTLALHADGTVTAWGYNATGQLGNGTTTNSATAVAVGGLSNVIAVDAGYEHSLALLANGTVMAWGDNYYGELGVGGSSVGGGPEDCEGAPCSRVPRQVPGLADVVAVDASYLYSLALLANGTVMAWGFDRYGQVGDGTGLSSGCECVQAPVQVSGVAAAMAISAGDYHGIAMFGDGTLRAWGENERGQIGNGSSIESAPPACLCVAPTVAGGFPGPVQEIAAGGYHTIALLGGGAARSWGYNDSGQVGNGIEPSNSCKCVPTAAVVAGLLGPQSFAAGEYHSLALLGDGTVWAWGDNQYGQLGDGSEADRRVAVQVSGLSGVSDISSGEDTSFALIGPSRSLNVSLAGAGTGTVGGPDGILCPVVSCVARFPDSQVQILRAVPAPGAGFAGFTGACTGTGICQVRMDADKTITATFGPPKGTKIDKAKIKQGKKPKKGAKKKPKPTAKAKFSFSAPGAVTGYQCMLVKPKPKKKKGKKAKKPKKPKFSSCASPKTYKKLKKGKYTFKVRAKNNLGVDAKPAVKKFRIKR
jgi:alpha-tubulin suppressor-like RCC1 family protein